MSIILYHIDWKHLLDFSVSAGTRMPVHTHLQLHLFCLGFPVASICQEVARLYWFIVKDTKGKGEKGHPRCMFVVFGDDGQRDSPTAWYQ